MADEPIVANATQAATVEPASTPSPEPANQAAIAEPAPATEPTPEPTVEPGAEPRESKVVRELKDQRRKRQDAEREAAYWRGQAESRTAPPPAPAPPATPSGHEPRIEEYEKYDDFLVAKAEWNVEQKAKANKTKEEEDQVQSQFTERIQKASESDPDILDLLNDQTLPISTPMAVVIKRMELGPQVLRFLANDRNESARIAKLSPLVAAAELGKIEMKIKNIPKPEVKTVSQAPTPITTVKPTGKIEQALDEIPIDDFMKRRNEAQYKRR